MSDDELFDDGLNDDEEEELALPSILAGISIADKRKLLQFKRTHNERAYEEEVERMIVPLQRKKQLEELRMMMGQEPGTGRSGAASKTPQSTRKRTARKKADSDDEPVEDATPAPAKRRPARRGRAALKDDSDADKSPAGSDAEESTAAAASAAADPASDDSAGGPAGADNDDDDDDDDDDDQWDAQSEESDLFRSDEEAEISQRPSRVSPSSKSGKSKVLGQKRRQTAATKPKSKRRARAQDDDEDADEDAEAADDAEDDFEDLDDDDDDGGHRRRGYDDEDEDDLDALGGGDGSHNIKHIKDAHRRASERADGSGGPGALAHKTKVFHNLDQLRTHLEDQRRLAPAPEPDDEEAAGFTEYLRVTLRRDEIIKCLGEPFLDEFLHHAFVRVSLGQQHGVTVYKLAQIVGVERNQRVDRLPATAFQASTSTALRLTVSIGGQVKDHQRISMLSNHTVTQQEVDSYRARLRQAQQPEPTKGTLRAVRLKQKRLAGHVYSHEEINQMVNSRCGLNKALTTDRTAAKERLLKKREEARVAKDYDLLERVGKELEALDRADEHDLEVYEKSQRRQVDLNRRMKDSNVKRDMAAGMRKRQEDQEAAARGIVSNAVSDPFIRRETRPKILWNTGRKKAAEGAEDKVGEAAVPSAAAPAAATTAPAAIAKRPKARDDETWLLAGQINLDQLRKNVKAVMGVDPVEHMRMSKKERYLLRACAGMPPMGSAQREALRGNGNKSLAEYIRLMN